MPTPYSNLNIQSLPSGKRTGSWEKLFRAGVTTLPAHEDGENLAVGLLPAYLNRRLALSLDTIKDIREIDTLLQEIDQHSINVSSDNFLHPGDSTIEHYVYDAIRHIRQAIELITPLQNDESKGQQFIYLSRFQFIICQLKNSLVSRHARRYNVRTLVVALKCQLISPVCYRFLHSLNCLCFPHHSTLNRLYSNFGMDQEFSIYLRQSTSDFNKWERNVIIQMDEIHVKSTFASKGGRIRGSSLIPTNPAKTVFH